MLLAYVRIGYTLQVNRGQLFGSSRRLKIVATLGSPDLPDLLFFSNHR